jgi:shikimate kinase
VHLRQTAGFLLGLNVDARTVSVYRVAFNVRQYGYLHRPQRMTFCDSNQRSIVLVGLMGAGKTSVGKRLARRLGMPFIDADEEISKAAGSSIVEIFARYGEATFRDGERRVIARLLADKPQVLATGGGAFIDPQTRALIAQTGISVWLRAALEVLVSRTTGRNGRPLLTNRDPRTVLADLIRDRYPVYTLADIIVDSDDGPIERTVDRVIGALAASGYPLDPKGIDS